MKNHNKMLYIKKPLNKKKAQEEMFGFGIIIALVSIVILVFLFFTLSSDQESFDSSKVESFVQAALSYTSDCEKYEGDYMDIGDLIYSCAKNETCVNGDESCNVLNSTLNNMLNQTWPAGEEWPTKGYEFLITTESEDETDIVIPTIEKGNKTNVTTIKSSVQNLPSKSDVGKVNVKFTVYE